MPQRSAEIEELAEQLRDAEKLLKGIKEEAKRLGKPGIAGNMDMAISFVTPSRRTLED